MLYDEVTYFWITTELVSIQYGQFVNEANYVHSLANTKQDSSLQQLLDGSQNRTQKNAHFLYPGSQQ